MITLADYFMGRDKTYASELTAELRASADETVRRANLLLELAVADGVVLLGNPVTKTLVSSGWRPAVINASTPGAALKSKHMLCKAIDIYDPEGTLDAWCLANPAVLEEFGLWQEDPKSTKTWCHLQTIPPRSGNRVFAP